jgi:hypothetical protein
MANIIVKNAANVDTTFSAIAGSSGDKLPAVWLNTASSTIRANRQKAVLEVHDNGNGSSRVLTGNVTIPYTQVVDGVEKIVSVQQYKIVGSQPKGIPDSVIADGSVIALNLFSSALFKATAAEQLAPRG